MRITGDATLQAPVAQVWAALLDPAVLVRTIPGCERLETTGENAYAMTVTAGVAAIRGTYAGSCELSDLDPHSSLVMRLNGAGAPGTVGATVQVGFSELDGGLTRIEYAADAIVGGMVGGVGQRMLTSVSRRMAGEFFGNVGSVLAGGPGMAPAAPAPAGAVPGRTMGGAREQELPEQRPGQVFTAPPKPGAIGARDDFVRGIAVGAGLVLLGVIAGSVFPSRRAQNALLRTSARRR